MEKAILSTADDIKPIVLSRDERIASSNDVHDINREKVVIFYLNMIFAAFFC